MSSPAEIKTCGVCLGNLATRRGQAIFTAECSHTFHFSCISNNIANGNHLCPLCQSKWNNLPFTSPISNTIINHSNTFNPPFYNPPFQFSPHFTTPQFPLFSQSPVFEPEPSQFSDDEPVPDVNPAPSDSLSGLQKVSIKAVPERPAIAYSESVSQFTVLVGLKAPSISDNARCFNRAPIDLVTVLDVSGSMCGSKLDLLKRAVHFVIDNLGPSDRLSIVSFAYQATRMLPLRRMTENGRVDAKRAVDSLLASGGTNIVEGLKKGVRVLEERRHKNPVTSIIFLSDGNDTENSSSDLFQKFPTSRRAPEYLHLLPDAIFPRNRGRENAGLLRTIPVHSFGFGSDHDPIAMHAISDASGGTFSFIESYEMVQDAFASCIGGLLSVVTQELRVTVRSASNGVEIKSIASGRYASEISNQGSLGLISVGDLYADEEKEFLINLSVPVILNEKGDGSERKTSLLDIMCSYKDVVSKEAVQIECDLVEIKRPEKVSPHDTIVNLEVDRQRNRLYAAESIAEAQQMAEKGNLSGARSLLAKRRSYLVTTASAQAGDGLSMWLENDMRETEKRMGSEQMYQQAGRAYALSGMSSHALQRATTKGNAVAGAAPVEGFSFGSARPAAAAAASTPFAAFGAFVTPNMANMVNKSQQLNKTGDNDPRKE